MRNPKLAAAAVAIVAAGLCACAATRSNRSKAPPPEAATELDVASSASINGTLETHDLGTAPSGARAIGGNAALRPSDPWYGTIGFKSGIVGDYAFGVGVYVPRPASTIQSGDTTVDRGGSVGLGVWVAIEF